MPYNMYATSQTPALVIYLIDVSASMIKPMKDRPRRLDVVTEAITVAIEEMIALATKGTSISPRYRLAIYAYSDKAYDCLSGVQSIDRVAQIGVPELRALRGTNTAAAFAEAEKLLHSELPALQRCPAPLICHLTDGQFDPDYPDPEPIARRIMSLSVEDGNVLIENIYISDRIMSETKDYSKWHGVLPETPLRSEYERKLRDMSSPFPTSYRKNMREKGEYEIDSRALMFLPGNNAELVRLGFQITTMTGLA
ncbi:vWA domain-containing protein [Petrachloros mirabilis]